MQATPSIRTLARQHSRSQLSVSSFATEMEEDQPDTMCGIGPFKPNWLQAFNNPYWMCTFMSVLAFLYGGVANGVNNINTASYERRFGLSSKSAAWVSGANDVSASILGIVVGFLGSHKYKARWLAAGSLIIALGCLLMGLPHFITGLYVWGKGDNRLCNKGEFEDHCAVPTDTKLQNYLYFLMAGHFLNGVSGCMILVIGMSYIDDSLPSTSSPFYTGIVNLFLYLGVVAGFALGGLSLNMYVDFDQVSREKWGLTPDDPRWVGAWWLPFFCSGAILLLLAIVFMLYGEELPSARKVREERQKQESAKGLTLEGKVKDGSSGAGSQEGRLTFRQFLVVLRRLMRQPTLVLLNLGYSLTFFMITGVAVFLSKIIQNQFGKSGTESALFAGGVILPGAAIGQFLGGYLVKKFELGVPAIIKMVFLMQLVVVPPNFSFFAYCDQVKLVGWNRPYQSSLPTGNQSFSAAFESSCNAGCKCRLDLYEPVCDVTGLQYFSPCFAGCSSTESNQTHVYSNCSCIAGNPINSTLTSEFCQRGCALIYPLMAGLFVSIVLCSAIFVPIQTAIFRISGEHDKTLAIGVMWFYARVLGAIPGPVALGAVIDVTCVVWGEKCGERSSCWVYDNAKLGRNVSILVGCCAFLAAMFYGAAYKVLPSNKYKASNMAEKCNGSTGSHKKSVSSVSSVENETFHIKNGVSKRNVKTNETKDLDNLGNDNMFYILTHDPSDPDVTVDLATSLVDDVSTLSSEPVSELNERTESTHL